jgi:hypothetical protein
MVEQMTRQPKFEGSKAASVDSRRERKYPKKFSSQTNKWQLSVTEPRGRCYKTFYACNFRVWLVFPCESWVSYIFVLMLPLKWERFLTKFVYSLITQNHRTAFLYQTEMEGREQDSGKTESESVWEAACSRKGEVASVIKWAIREIHVAK